MKLRPRILLATSLLILLPLLLLSLVVRELSSRRLSRQYVDRVETLGQLCERSLTRGSARTGAALRKLCDAMIGDQRNHDNC